jgi:sigma-B regulation protein RsbU (phosphoserine phosphatase)
VVGADIFLNGVAEAVSASAENAGFVCIVNQDGKVLFSPQTEGTFAAVRSADSKDLRTLGNEELSSFINLSLREKTDMVTIEVDGKTMCMAGAPIEAVGWCLLTLVEESVLQQPAEAMVDNYNTILAEAEGKVARNVSSSQFTIIFWLLAVMAMAMGAALALAKKIVSPLNRMTERLKELRQGDSSFTMEDTFKTGDEIQVLAETFADLSSRIRSYITHITEITAEKQRIGTELALAQKIQTDMLPNIFPPFPERDDMDIYAYMKPAKEVGGDFYDFFLIDEDHLALVMADVSGKGIPAALFMMMSKILLNTNTMLSASPKDVLEKVNEQICRNNEEEMFVTVWLGILTLSTGHMVAANAGHEYPILRKPDGKFEIFKDRHSFVIGGMEGTRYREYEMTLDKSGTLFLYTDGVAEAANEDDELFGTQRMLDALNQDPDADAYHVLVNMNNAVKDFVGDAPQFDDLTMLAIRRP